MKKLIILFCMMFFLTGCGEYSEKDIVKELNKKISANDGYMLEGNLEILNNEEVYSYDVSVGY